MSTSFDFGVARRLIIKQLDNERWWEETLVALAKLPPFNVADRPGGTNPKVSILNYAGDHVFVGTGSEEWNAFIQELGGRIRVSEQPYRRANYDDPQRMKQLVEFIAREFALNSPHNA